MRGNWPKDFIGRVVNRIDISDGGSHIRFHFGEGSVISLHDEIREALRLKMEVAPKDVVTFSAYGDCCSHSWVESFDGADTMIGHTILSAEDVSIAALPRTPDDGYDHVQDYCWRFTTTQGHADLIFRNDSNGYYGGSLEEAKMPVADEDWRVVIK